MMEGSNTHILEIQHFGPIEKCEIVMKDFIVLNGAQASGKSTVAKCIYFFRDFKNLVIQEMYKVQNRLDDEDYIEEFLFDRIQKEAKDRFIRFFGDVETYHPDMEIGYYYASNKYVNIQLLESGGRSRLQIGFSPAILQEVKGISKIIGGDKSGRYEMIRKQVYDVVFQDDTEAVYIPAGRSLITLLNGQLDFLYATMDDEQKRRLDYCTQNFIERILRIRAYFSKGLDRLIEDSMEAGNIRPKQNELSTVKRLYRHILKGDYSFAGGEEYLYLPGDGKVKMNIASSGQQEAVWIINVLLYYWLNGKKACYIIEEPETHLYPDAQKAIAELLVMMFNTSNEIMITTHSPYILGSINNMLYAHKIADHVNKAQLISCVSEELWLEYNRLGAYFLENGEVRFIGDAEHQDIDHGVIDGASDEINLQYEQMVNLVWGERGQ